MARILFLIVICAISLSLTNVQAQETIVFENSWGEGGLEIVSQSPEGVDLIFSTPFIQLQKVIVDGKEMTKVILPGALLGNNAGAPDLPGISRYLAFPQGASINVEIIESRFRTLNLDVLPAPPIQFETDDSPPVFIKDERIYNQDTNYPEDPIAFSNPQVMRGVDAFILGVTPFAYNPISKDLVVYSDLKIRVSFTGGNGRFGDTSFRSRWFEPILKQHLLNYSSLPVMDYSLGSAPGGASTTSSRAPGECEYMIFAPNNPTFLTWAETIKEFRTKQGIITKIFNINDIGGTANAIENTINNAYNNWALKPVAVLMLGDQPVMPVKTWNSYCLSDNIYADVTGNDLPDVNIARITANNSTELQTTINKFIGYETNPPTNPGFYDNPIIAGGWQTSRWFILCTEVVLGYLTNQQSKTPVREYAIYSGTPGSDWSTATNTSTVVNYFGPSGLGYIPSTPSHLTDWGGNASRINNDINSGAFYMLHRDHGSNTGWGEPDYQSSDLSGLNNDDLCFVMSINCLTGQYNYSPECFTEVFHRMDKGALGLIAASEISYSFVNDTFVWGMHDTMWPDFDPGYGGSTGDNVLMPGFAQASGKWYLQASSWPYNTSSKVTTHHLFHLHGDAFTILYTEPPQNLTVSHAATISGTATSFQVTADAGSFIGLSANGEVLGTAESSGGATNVTITAPGSSGTMYVTVTKPNYYRYEGQVTISAGGPPIITSIGPEHGKSSGGTSCIISGNNFTTTADTTVRFGGALATNLNVINSNLLSCSSPPHSAGTVDVQVTNSNGSDILYDAFTYHNAPTISSVSPGSGPSSGGTSVTVTGSNFTTASATSVRFGGTLATSVTMVNSTTVTCNTPAHSAGLVDVQVSNAYGNNTLNNGFSYTHAPTIASCNPGQGPMSGGTTVTITGAYFTSSPDTDVTFGGNMANGVTVLSSTLLTCVTPSHGAGSVDVAVINSNGSAVLTNGFIYVTSPLISSIVPPTGPIIGGTSVTIYGSNFASSASTTIMFGGAECNECQCCKFQHYDMRHASSRIRAC